MKLFQMFSLSPVCVCFSANIVETFSFAFSTLNIMFDFQFHFVLYTSLKTSRALNVVLMLTLFQPVELFK